MRSKYIRRIVYTAMLASLTCVATMVIRIPSPMEGYINLGDGFVIIGAWLLGPFYGMLAGGIGSAAADLLGGYAVYVPATLIIKGLSAMTAGFLWKKNSPPRQIVAGVAAEIVMVSGYFLYAALLMGNGWSAAASIPGNILQGAVGIAVAMLINIRLEKTDFREKYLKYK